MKRTRHRATGIVIKNNSVLVIGRRHKGEKYNVFPGGGVENVESIEGALVREMKDELSINVKGCRRLKATRETEYIDGEVDKQIEHYFLVDDYDGEVRLGPELVEKSSPDNIYAPVWVPVENIKEVVAVSEQDILEEAFRLLK